MCFTLSFRTSELYKSAGIHIDENRIQEIVPEVTDTPNQENNESNNQEEESDHFSEVDESEARCGNIDTFR